MMEPIIIAIIGSGAFSALISGIFGLIQARKNRQKQIEEEIHAVRKQLDLYEKDNLRTQLLLLIKDFPDETTDILRLAQHYFHDLHGNWVLTDIFTTWAKAKGVEIPSWFKEDNK